jgi:DNA repair exonuclease SbcCD ATPase subunit
MDILLRQKQSELSKSVTDVSHRYDLMKEKYELQNSHFIQIRNRDESDITERKDKIDQDTKDQEQYNTKLKDLNDKIILNKTELKDSEKATQTANQLSKLEAKIETNLLNHKKNLEFFESNSKCPTCTQEIGVELRTEKLAEEKAKITKLELGLKDLISEIIKTETKINEYAKLTDWVNELGIEVAKIDTSITEINKHSTRLQEEINKLTYDTTNTESIQLELSVIKVQLAEIESEKNRVVDEKQYIDIAREILNDTGVKANIIKKYLPIMNQLINENLQAMDFFINFHLNEEFEETIKSRHRDTFNYNNFSEGEKMRIDLALLFTWRAIAKLKNSVNTNILILDEIFDSSLDGQGTDDFFKILKSLNKENVFIISHKGDIMFDKFTNIIKFEKHKNFTRLL